MYIVLCKNELEGVVAAISIPGVYCTPMDWGALHYNNKMKEILPHTRHYHLYGDAINMSFLFYFIYIFS